MNWKNDFGRNDGGQRLKWTAIKTMRKGYVQRMPQEWQRTKVCFDSLSQMLWPLEDQ